MVIGAALFDVGGPLDLETLHERLIDRHIRDAFAAQGHPIIGACYAAAARRAVRSFAPDAYRAIVWTLAGDDVALATRVYESVAARSGERDAARGGIEPRPGIGEVLAWLRGRGIVLGLAANQPARMLAHLDRAGLGQFFDARGVSGTHGLRKPDVRLFLHACAALNVVPAECVMVGDRIDNDIAPARLLGMRTVLLRTGRHRRQQPRSWDEVPDEEIEDSVGLRAALERLLAGG